jgi:ComF family protein
MPVKFTSFLSKIWLADLFGLFFPNVCVACGRTLNRQEEILCTSCLYKLPKTGFHMHAENLVAETFWGRVELHSAASFLFFSKKGKVQKLMHVLKYKGRKEVGVYLGRLFGTDLKESPLFNTVEMIVPVPLHPKKQRKRGFNQSVMIARGIGEALGVPVSVDNLIRTAYTSSQTKKSRYDRWQNVKGVFSVQDPELFRNKHLLIVDDVLTTGATMEACVHPLLEIPGTKVSVATLASTQA